MHGAAVRNVQERQHSVVSGISMIKKYILESFSELTGVSIVVKVGNKSATGGWTGVEETMFSKSSSCSWQNVNH